jgi:hypothetical protein
MLFTMLPMTTVTAETRDYVETAEICDYVETSADVHIESYVIDFLESDILALERSESSLLLINDEVSYYGRDQLAKLPNSEALIYAYEAIVDGIEASAASITVYNGKNPISGQEFEMVMDMYRRDYVHHFWIGNSYNMYSDSKTVRFIEPTYIMSGDELEQAKIDFEEEAEKMLSGLDASTSVVGGGVVCTSGAGGVFPDGLLIGQVKAVHNDDVSAGFYAEIKPFADLSKISEVFVITSFEGQGEE